MLSYLLTLPCVRKCYSLLHWRMSIFFLLCINARVLERKLKLLRNYSTLAFWGMLAFTMLRIKSDFLEPEYSVPNRN